MSLIKDRKVENIELFYDLIFVYAISKISELAHHTHNGIIEPLVLISFILSSLAVLQEWLYLTNYLNRFGTFNIKEIIIMCKYGSCNLSFQFSFLRLGADFLSI